MMLAGSLMTFSACSDDEWAPGAEQTEGARAYLYADASSYTFLPDDEQAVTFHVARADASTDATVGLSVDAEGFTVPASVSFAAGEDIKDVQVTFDIPIGSSTTATVSISEGDSYVYGASQLTLNITRDYTWQSQGTWILTCGYGTLYVAGTGTLSDTGIEANFEFFVSAGSFGVFPESFTKM